MFMTIKNIKKYFQLTLKLVDIKFLRHFYVSFIRLANPLARSLLLAGPGSVAGIAAANPGNNLWPFSCVTGWYLSVLL